MEQAWIEALSQYGVLGVLLFAVLYWLAKHFLPMQELRHREELGRIMSSHEASVKGIVAALDRNTRVVQLLSQSVMVENLKSTGLSHDEAERLARRITIGIGNGIDNSGFGN